MIGKWFRRALIALPWVLLVLVFTSRNLALAAPGDKEKFDGLVQTLTGIGNSFTTAAIQMVEAFKAFLGS